MHHICTWDAGRYDFLWPTGCGWGSIEAEVTTIEEDDACHHHNDWRKLAWHFHYHTQVDNLELPKDYILGTISLGNRCDTSL